MKPIDSYTVIVLSAFVSGLMALVLLVLKRDYPASIKGLGEWSAALMLVCLATSLAVTRGKLPDIVAISLSRVLMGVGLYFSYRGTQRFFGVSPRIGRWLAAGAVLALSHSWFTVVQPNFNARLAIAVVLGMGLLSAYLKLVLQQAPLTLGRVMTAVVLLALAATLLSRLLPSLASTIDLGVFNAMRDHEFYVATFAFCTFLLSIGAVLMATERLHAELDLLATRDSLTNALTRRRLDEACGKELKRCQRNGRSLALLVMDMDHFKAVNDTWGHQVGDRVLVNFVARVQPLLRGPDQLARFGGEEFVALLPETSLSEAVLVAERIRQTCAADSQAPVCTVSVGVTTNQRDDDTVDSLFARADAALYRAKANGRNRVETA